MYKIVFFVFVMIFMQGCFEEKKKTIRVGISPWPGYEGLVFGMEKGFFDKIDLRIVRFLTPTESFRALRDGAVDVAAFTADEILHYTKTKNKPKMFLVLDISNGGDAIVARPGIESLDDFRGKNIGVEPSALGHYFLHRSMDFTKGLQVKDFTVVPVDIDKHVSMYEKGLVDAVITYEPSRSLLLKEGAKVIFDSKQIPGEIIDVLVTEDKTLIENQKALKLLADGWFETVAYIKLHKQEAMQKMASYEYISVQEFEKAYDDLIIPTRQENIKMLGDGMYSYEGTLKRLSKLMLEIGSISNDLDTQELITDIVIKQ